GFVFQAEDGIRDFHVTGVQTCALPICRTRPPKRGARRRMTRTQLRRLIEAHDEVWLGWWPRLTGLTASQARRTLEGRWPSVLARSEERRVGRDSRYRRRPEQ